MIQIIKSSTKEFTPHMAVTHMALNAGSANEENVPLVMKAAKEGADVDAVLAKLGEGSEDVIQKASYRNKQRMIESALRDSLKSEDDEEYFWVYMEDFDESTIVFEFRSKVYSVTYTMENGVVLLGTEITEVVRQDVYVAVDGSVLVLKAVAEVEGDEVDPTVNAGDSLVEEQEIALGSSQERDTEMKEEEVQALVLKAAAAAKAEARVEIEAEIAQAEVVKSAGVIVKGFSFIAEEDVETVVKALVAMGDEMPTVVKALNDAKAAIEVVEAEKETIKKEFGTQKSVEDKPEIVAEDTMSILKANVAAAKLAKAKVS